MFDILNENNDGIIQVPSTQPKIEINIRLNIEDTIDSNDPNVEFNHKSVLLRLVSTGLETEWIQGDEHGAKFILPISNDVLQMWALEVKGFNASESPNFCILPCVIFKE